MHLLLTRVQIGKKLADIRKKRSLSQEELANFAHVERSHMGKIERGEHLPNLVLILRLAKALSIEPGSLVDTAAELLIQLDDSK